ncbi:MAG TPA: hypothetical protein VGK67_03160 [Myxococcales bacterium]|jgi:hypothetical protein
MARRAWTVARALGLLLPALLVAAALAGCASGAAPRSDVTKPPADAPGNTGRSSARYADGSGNVYALEGDRLRYSPVTPEASSSGTYSGGDPFEKTLSPQDLSDLTRALDAALEAKGSHIQDRVMMSGAVTLERTGERQSFILAAGCPEQRALEAVLARLVPARRD